jgi:uncharacterized protein
MEHYLLLILLGFVVGTYGTLIGAGGGFVLMPVLLILYPAESPEIIASISLAVVFFNALSGSFAYARMKRIDYKSGMLFALATIPGAILGALSTSYVPRLLFNALLGILMIGGAIFLLFYSAKNSKPKKKKAKFQLERDLVDNDGIAYTYTYNPALGSGLSCFIGYISSFLGIGGGIIHVPVLARLLNFPVHIATATSHFILAIMALTGTLVHVITGSFSHGIQRAAFLSVGVLLGAQLGAVLSRRMQGRWIVQALAIALGFVGVRVLIMVL